MRESRVTRAVEKLEQKKRSLQSQIKSEQEKREQQLQQAYLGAAHARGGLRQAS